MVANVIYNAILEDIKDLKTSEQFPDTYIRYLFGEAVKSRIRSNSKALFLSAPDKFSAGANVCGKCGSQMLNLTGTKILWCSNCEEMEEHESTAVPGS